MDEETTSDSINIGITLLPEIPHHKDNKGLWIFGESESKRRVITIEKKNGSYGFTLQSYGVRYKHGHRETDFITYVNAVEKDGASYLAGLREGDVILSINGQNMGRVEHKSLVSFIRKSPASLKMVVVSDERARKVELHMRYVHLQKKLQDKTKELDELNWKEKMITTGVYRHNAASGSPLADLTFSQTSTTTGSIGLVEQTAKIGDGKQKDPSTVCCFCPQQRSASNTSTNLQLQSTGPQLLLEKQPSQSSQTQTVHIVRITEKKPSKSNIKIFDKETGNTFNNTTGYDCYRKCQSSRELSSTPSTGGATPRSRNNSIGGEEPHHSKLIHNQQRSTIPNTTEPFTKPKSWDNVMLGGNTDLNLPGKFRSVGGTKSFGGYGFGYGYGYYSQEGVSRGVGAHHYHHNVTHPHHHNHHSHCSHTHAQHGNYYYNASSNPKKSQHESTRNQFPVPTAPNPFYKYNTIVNPYQYQGTSTTIEPTTAPPGLANSTTEPRTSHTRSKTLPSKRPSSANRTTTPTDPLASTKLEKTLSDSSLNSEHHKEFPKTMSYFKRSGDNVRFSSDEEFYGGGGAGYEGRRRRGGEGSAGEREHIFV